VRVVVGWWSESPFGAFGDAMVETASGHRVLLAPSDEVAELVASTYTFDEVRVEPFEVAAGIASLPPVATGTGARAEVRSLAVRSPSLSLAVGVGGRTALGRLLHLFPRPVAESPAFAGVADPVARLVLRGVRTRGSARAGRREYYGATDVHEVTSASGRFDGADLGDLAPVEPPCRFGFSSTPRRPSVTDVVTTVVDTR
jgi:hypothetical protein